MNKSTNLKNNKIDNNIDPSGNPENNYPWFLNNNNTNTNSDTSTKNKFSTGMIILYIFIYLICAMLIPSCILYFITKWSAKSALKTTPCGNPDLLKSLFQSSTSPVVDSS